MNEFKKKLKLNAFEFVFRLVILLYKHFIFDRRGFKIVSDVESLDFEFEEDNNYFACLKNKAEKMNASMEENSILELMPRYCGYASIRINKILLGKEYQVDYPELYYKDIEILTKLISNRSLKYNYIVFRITDRYYRFRKGEIYLEKSFLSTSLNPRHRNDNKETMNGYSNKDLLIIMVPACTKAIYLEQISNRKEYELLIDKNQHIKVLNVFFAFGNRLVLLEILDH